jgi:hypothetical protein
MSIMRKLPVVPFCRSYDFHKSTILAAFHSNGGAGRDRHERGMECDGRELCRMACDMDADGKGVWA